MSEVHRSNLLIFVRFCSTDRPACPENYHASELPFDEYGPGRMASAIERMPAFAEVFLPRTNETFMNTSTSTPFSRACLAILWGGLACGIGDISQAFVVFGLQSGAKPMRILQSVAAGLIGRNAFEGGWKTAFLGAALHFFIALTVAVVYYTASRWISFMNQHAVISGLLYGEMVFLVMYFFVLPLSATGKGLFTLPTFSLGTYITGPIGHTFLVGLPVALIVRRYSR